MSVKTNKKPRAKGRLSPGELDGLVLGHLRKQDGGDPLTASAVAKGIDRSAGAVANCLGRLKKDGKVNQGKKSPRAFVIAEKTR